MNLIKYNLRPLRKPRRTAVVPEGQSKIARHFSAGYEVIGQAAFRRRPLQKSVLKIPEGFNNPSRWLSPPRAITTGRAYKKESTPKGLQNFLRGKIFISPVMQPLRGRLLFKTIPVVSAWWPRPPAKVMASLRLATTTASDFCRGLRRDA